MVCPRGSKSWWAGVAVILVVVGGTLWSGSPADAQTWTNQNPVARQFPTGSLAAVSCSSSTACTAVGSHIAYIPENFASVTASLVERWNGTSWTVQHTPQDAGTSVSALAGVSCPTATDCTAVGTTNGNALAEQWNGTNWIDQGTPIVTGTTSSSLTAVSCRWSNSCTAVGTYKDPSSGDQLPLAEQWNGKSWALMSAPLPATAINASLTAVSCWSLTSCTAVGTYTTANEGWQFAFAAQTNGTTWTVQTLPAYGGVRQSFVTGVSCPSSKFCLAVGYNNHMTGVDEQSLSLRWNGTKWSIPSTPNPSNGPALLAAVGCSAWNACTAVGAGYNAPVAERWNGTSWTLQTPPNTSAGDGSLSGVACQSSTACTAVGTSGPMDLETGKIPLTLAEQWDGTNWGIQTTPNGSGSQDSQLNSVSCPVSTYCMAVGSAGSYSYATPGYEPESLLAEQWNGTRWTLERLPNPDPSYPLAQLSGVSCTSSTFCTAVGSSAYAVQNPQRPIIEQWNGTEWTAYAMPAGTSGGFTGVSCSSPTACTAVGSGLVAERWDGTSWVAQTMAQPKGYSSYITFDAVSCSSATWCMALGVNAGAPFSEVWDGTTWSIRSIPNPGYLSLTALSCVTSTDCVTVGSSANTGSLAAMWNGGSWSLQTMPGAPSSGVSCTATRACTAVSNSTAEQWNGTSWVPQSLPTPTGAVFGVSCSSATACTAVGWYGGPNSALAPLPLAYRYS